MPSSEEIKARLNLETGKLSWQELERYFAKGILIHVSNDFDLLEIAAAIAEDQKEKIKKLLDSAQVSKPDIKQAEKWHVNETVFWTVVVVPWILIQEMSS